ncbi:uncharacterized protein LOC115884599 [Sitophilus oryzae]|uniref:Uncharacterized protein LOC115884599 n=1 Tax=Sitophilus oryzae TaxID=7048 RepID=A0A6J2Y5I9_SITOR|nr:uncharacterized protein LOC115884599 [Sitophilus oryzae]
MVLLLQISLILIGVSFVTSITTIHHDKPESVTITTITSTTPEKTFDSSTAALDTEEVAIAYNVTLAPSERQKRLLPYENFYFNQPFNRPHLAGVSAQQYRDFPYEKRRPLKSESQNYRPKDVLYQQRPKFTPFLESNALPGPFRPMVKPQNQPQTINDEEEEKYHSEEEQSSHPDFSAIYDKLAQLKLRQHSFQKQTSYGYRIVPYQRPHKEEEIRPVEYPNRLKYKVQPTKTTYETFTATNIDIPSPDEEQKYHYEPQTYQTSSGKEEEAKPYVHQQITLEIPRGSIPLVFNPPLVKKPVSSTRVRPVKPYIVLHQDKPYSRQPVFVLRKPKPIPVIEENYTAQKLIPISPEKHHHGFLRRPIYVPQDPPRPTQYDHAYETQYQATQAPIEPSVNDYGSYIAPPSYNQEEYGSRVTPRPQKIEFVPIVTSPRPEYQGPSEYYAYGTVESTSERVATPKVVTARPEIEVFQEGSSEESQSLANILRKLQETNALPHTITPDNIDNSIKTLVKILNTLKLQQKQQKPIIVQDYSMDVDNEAGVDLFDTPAGGTPGKAGIDYPALSNIPKTSFSCKTQRYKGFFADTDTNCQVWHYCDLNGGQASFLCPNGTIFSQVALTCDWWYNVKCSSTTQLYVLNERLYKYIIPLSPKFPEDYTGPLVDKYLAMKFQEMEEKLRKQKKGKGNSDKSDEDSTETSESSEEDTSKTVEENTSTESTEEETTLDNATK